MKKVIITIVIALSISWNVKSQNNLAMLYSSTGIEYGKANTVDADNNYINATLFQNTINVNPSGVTNLVCAGAGIDVGLTKYNSQGQLIWGKRFGGTACTETPHGVDCDAAKNIYVTGFFGSTTFTGPLSGDFNPAGGNEITTQGSEDAFLAKYDENGNYIWALGLGNSLSETRERGWDLVVDASGNSYVAGGFSGSVNFNPLGTANVVTNPDSLTGLFIAKYNTNGILQWVVPINAQLNDIFTEGYATIDFDANGNLYVAGNFRGTNANFNPNATPSTLSSSGQCDIFIAQYNASNGTLNWLKRIGTALQELVSPGALRCDNNGNPYFTGRVSGTNSVDFDPNAGITNVTNSSLYIASYDINGNIRFAKGMNSGTGDGGHRVSFDSLNNVYVAGWMNGTATFGTIIRTANAPTADNFLAKYSNDLNTCQWALNFGGIGASANNIVAGLSVDQENNAIITGQLYGTDANVNPLGATPKILSSVGQNDCFVVKYKTDGTLWESTPLGIEGNQNGNKLFKIYPNPTSNFIYIDKQSEIKELSIYNLIGQKCENKMENNKIDVSNLAKGTYFLKLSDHTGKFYTTKFIKE